ncbi:MAG TPA: hypothetical protein VNT22_07160 [Baekduia sp.]|nr:hypothetical protein [Baekduia sp.]
MRSGVVFVSEDFDGHAPPPMWSGRWSAHWESEYGQFVRRGPQNVSAQEAIAWGREHVDVVQIRPGDSDAFYCAGVRPPDDEPDCPRWPDGQELPRRRAVWVGLLDASGDHVSMTRDSSGAVFLGVLDRLGVRGGRIDLPDVWPILAAWWSTPVSDLAFDEQEELEFLLSLAPATKDVGVSVFAGCPPDAIAGRELVCLEFSRGFHKVLAPNHLSGISGGAHLTFWYAYDAPWQRLRECSSWIEMGLGTPQLDASSRFSDPPTLIRYIGDESGVLDAAAEQPALALCVSDELGEQELLVVR